VNEGATPFVVRVAAGDITQAQATVIVVNHFNGLPPSGAEKAIDRILGGAISRRAGRGALESHFGATHFLPAEHAPLAASAVLVIGLGDPEKFTEERLPEVGAALVEALATFGIRDAATILHGAGSAGTPPEQAATLFTEGLLTALPQVRGADCFRELLIVEKAEERVGEIERGIRVARGGAGVHLYVESGTLEQRTAPVGEEPSRAVPEHLRIGITRAGTELRVTIIGHGAYDCAAGADYPAALSQRLTENLSAEVLTQSDAGKRATALESIGAQLYNAFLGWTPFELMRLLQAPQARYVVFRLDRATAALPWETLFAEEGFISRDRLLARQLEAEAPGRQAPLREPGRTVNVLVVGDPKGDLPGAREEAASVAEALRQLPHVAVRELINDVTYESVSRELDTTNYDVLHYAGHAHYDGLRKSSGLELKDATLTAEDLSTRRYFPQLIFANACNSAQMPDGRADFYSGAQATRDLVGGMLRAGVRTFIGSSWAVDDDVAATFAKSFYTTLVGRDENDRRAAVGDAVRLAREAVVADHGPGAHGWAGYALYGSPWLPIVDEG
jgi:CHAT domain-containing protein